MVERAFRQSKDDDLVGVMPLRHWTGGKIRCRLFTCIVALTYLRLPEMRLRRSGLMITARHAVEVMQRLHSRLCRAGGRSAPKRRLEELAPTQAEIIAALGVESAGGVPQKKKN